MFRLRAAARRGSQGRAANLNVLDGAVRTHRRLQQASMVAGLQVQVRDNTLEPREGLRCLVLLCAVGVAVPAKHALV